MWATFLSAVSRHDDLRLLQPSLYMLTLVPRGQRAPLDEFRTLLIDRSAELVESFMPSRGRTFFFLGAPVVSSHC